MPETLDLRTINALEGSAALIGVYDNGEQLIYANAAFREAYFLAPDELIDWGELMRRNHAAGRGTVIVTDDLEAWLCSVRSRRGKTSIRTYESDLHDGRWIWVTETMQPDGSIIYVGADVTQLNVSARHLRQDRDLALQASRTDDLTGISNRRHVMGQLEDMIAQATDETPGCACLMDVDHFKSVNDTFGHQIGDEVLIRFARRVREAVRLRDAFGRVGGEEFLLVMPNTCVDQAIAVVERIYDAVRGPGAEPLLPDKHVTFSAGLSVFGPGDNAASVYSRCDAALYRSKADGRDRLTLDSSCLMAS